MYNLRQKSNIIQMHYLCSLEQSPARFFCGYRPMFALLLAARHSRDHKCMYIDFQSDSDLCIQGLLCWLLPKDHMSPLKHHLRSYVPYSHMKWEYYAYWSFWMVHVTHFHKMAWRLTSLLKTLLSIHTPAGIDLAARNRGSTHSPLLHHIASPCQDDGYKIRCLCLQVGNNAPL